MTLYTRNGMRKWVAEGVTVYQFANGYRHVLREHRLVVIPPDGSKVCRGDMRSDRFYIHIYQTKISRSENDIRFLKSREIAVGLNKNFGDIYFPRSRDVPQNLQKQNFPKFPKDPRRV